MKNLNKKLIIIVSGFLATMVVIFGLGLTSYINNVSAAGTFDVSFTETGERRSCENMPPFSNIGSKYFTYTITAVNNSNKTYSFQKAAFHSNQAGCSAFYDAPGGGWEYVSGKETYAPGESGTLVYRYNVNTYNCGRVQYDVAYQSKDGTDHHVFIGVMINYGKDCVPIPPTPTPTPTLSCSISAYPSSGTSPLNDVNLTATTSGTATGKIVYAFDCTNNGTWEYTSAATSLNPYTRANLCNYQSAGTYTIKAKVRRGNISTTCTNKVFVNPVPSPVSCSISANPSTILNGQSSTLNWTSQNANSCVASNAWSGTKAISGTQSVSPNYNSTYILNCSGLGGTAVCSALVSVTTTNPDLDISKSVNKRYAEEGEEIIYTLNYQNTGNAAAYDVVIRDPFINLNQDYLNFVSSSPGPSSGTNTWHLGTLSAGESGQITIRARIDSWMPEGTTEIENRFSIQSNETGTIYSNFVSTFVSEDEEDYDYSSLRIEKFVRNLTRGSSYWSNSVYAEPGDEIEFFLRVTSNGDEVADNVRVRDELPSRLEYVSGSTTVNGSHRSDGILSSSGISIGDMDEGDVEEIRFKAEVANEYNFYSNLTTLINYGYAWASDVSRVSDTAQVNVEKESSEEFFDISISKTGRNVSQEQSNWYESFVASPSEELEFSIQVTNIGDDDLYNVKVWDTLPSRLLIISNSTTVDGSFWGGDVAGAGLNIGTLQDGQTKTIKFRARVADKNNFSSSTTLVNVARVSATNVGEHSDEATVIIQKGEVLGVSIVTGINLLTSMVVLSLFSLIIAFMIYCRLREEKVLDYLNSNKGNAVMKFLIRNYFKVKYVLRVTALRFKKVYW